MRACSWVHAVVVLTEVSVCVPQELLLSAATAGERDARWLVWLVVDGQTLPAVAAGAVLCCTQPDGCSRMQLPCVWGGRA